MNHPIWRIFFKAPTIRPEINDLVVSLTAHIENWRVCHHMIDDFMLNNVASEVRVKVGTFIGERYAKIQFQSDSDRAWPVDGPSMTKHEESVVLAAAEDCMRAKLSARLKNGMERAK